MLQLDKDKAWLLNIRKVISPNCDKREAGHQVDLLVIHGISLPPAVFGGSYIDQFFTNTLREEEDPYFKEIAEQCVSAHLFINREGELTQYVPFTQRAWHAGESEFKGRGNCNDNSIGIELEGVDDQPYENKQYIMLAAVTDCLVRAWPAICKDRIVGHADIAPARKTDPGPAFSWEYYFSLCSVF